MWCGQFCLDCLGISSTAVSMSCHSVDSDGVFDNECVDWFDLERKMECIVHFAVKCNKDVSDSFFIDIKDCGERWKPRKDVHVVWYAKDLRGLQDCDLWRRNHHLELVRQHFNCCYDYNVLFKPELPFCVDFVISTPPHQQQQ